MENRQAGSHAKSRRIFGRFLLTGLLVISASFATDKAAAQPAAQAAVTTATATAAAPSNEPWKERLNASPRHAEWVEVKHGERTLHCFVVYPEVKDKATAVIVIHENMGLNDWARGLADELAEAGFIAVAPDLLSGMGPGGGKTSDFADGSSARDAIGKLNTMRDQVTADLNAAADYAARLDACNGKVAVAGFCWGGGQSFLFAAERPDLKAAFVFYGPAPSDEMIGKIKAPVYGFYGGSDARITAGVKPTEEKMKAAGKTFEPVVYDGARHAFMRAGETAPEGDPNKKARDAAWTRMVELLKKL